MSLPTRPAVDALAPYVPGEQPQTDGWVKLNTNENPYPPSPAAVEAIERTARDRLNVYPDPLGTPFREAAAEVLDLPGPDWVLPGNGSDDNLTILMRTFVDAGQAVACPYPSYILYETLAAIQGADVTRLMLDRDWSFGPRAAAAARRARLLLVPNPNSPSGTYWSAETLDRLRPDDGVLVHDGAYADFATGPGPRALLSDDGGSRSTVLTRSLSKSYGLAGLRFGFAVARPETVAAMNKVKDSYNCDALAIAAAAAALRDRAWFDDNRAKIVATRARLTAGLRELGFDVTPSDANFVWSTHPSGRHAEIYAALKARRILVRFMKFPDATAFGPNGLEGLRVSVGTDPQIDLFLQALREILPSV
ncbi:MAG: histidinol-phosphate transaminase [Planctomycetota bacterium]